MLGGWIENEWDQSKMSVGSVIVCWRNGIQPGNLHLYPARGTIFIWLCVFMVNEE